MKKITSLIAAAMFTVAVLSTGVALAHDDEGMGNTFKAVEKADHMKAFPQGHPATKNSLNRCYYDESDNLYFCQYPLVDPGGIAR